MSSKNYIDVVIDGKIYNIGGFESEAYLQKVASYIGTQTVRTYWKIGKYIVEYGLVYRI